MFIFNALAPVFVLIAVGAFAYHRGLLDARTLQGVNRLACWVGLPALLFHGTATANYAATGVGNVVLVTIVAGVTVTIVAAVLAWKFKLPAVTAGTFVHVAMRSNLSFVGLPVIFYVVASRPHPESETLRTLAMLAFAPYLLFQNTTGIIALLVGRHRPGVAMLRLLAKDVFTHPLLIAIALGVAVGLSGHPLPLFLSRSLESIGAIAAPIALIVIGASLVTRSFRGSHGPALTASVLKVFLMPLVGWIVALQCGLERDQLLVALVFLACPTGASSFSLVAEMNGDQPMASATIVVSTLLAVIPLALAVGLA
jgi:malate permease and related proteins